MLATFFTKADQQVHTPVSCVREKLTLLPPFGSAPRKLMLEVAGRVFCSSYPVVLRFLVL